MLLAPDGFQKNPMYRFAVETRLGRAAWAWTDRHAITVRSWIRGLRRMRIIPAHIEHFALHHTEDHAMRTLVAHTWKTHRAFWPTRRGSQQAWDGLAARRVAVHAVFGTRDAIIPWAWSKPWRSLSSDHVHMFVSVPPKLAISDLVRKMKGRSSYKLQREFLELKKRYWGRKFWGRGYFSTTNGAISREGNPPLISCPSDTKSSACSI